MEKLKSRKLWVAVLASVAQVFLPAVGVPAEIVENVVKILGFYVATQSVVDAAGEFRK